MDDLIPRIAAAAAIEPDVARKAVGIILSFLQKEGPPAEVDQLLDCLPGARALAAANSSLLEGTGAAGGLMGAMGGGLMGLAGQLTSAGLGMSEMQAIGKELFSYAREKAGEDTVGEIAGAIPGLGQFV